MTARVQRWLDGTAFHHRWVGNGPLWFLCRDCRALRDEKPEGFWELLRRALR